MNGSRDTTVATPNAAAASKKPLSAELRSASGEAGTCRMGCDRLPDELPQLFAKNLAIKFAGVRTQLIGRPIRRLGAANSTNQVVDLLLFKEHARPAIDDRVQRTT